MLRGESGRPSLAGSARTAPGLLPMLVVLLAAPAFAAGTTAANGTTRQCVDPCFQAARAAQRECLGSASGAFADALDGCVARDHQCVDACRGARADCRDDTDVGAVLADCHVALAVERARCRSQYRPGSIRLATCLDRAEAAASRCRRQARRELRRDLVKCQEQFGACVDACGGGAPPLGSGQCRAEAKAALQSHVAGCRRTFQQTASACIGKDVMCVPDCADARDTCNAPAQQALEATLTACRDAEGTAAAACVAANPAGSPALQQCVQGAQATAFACRQAAVDAAAPAFAPCTQAYGACLKACPAA